MTKIEKKNSQFKKFYVIILFYPMREASTERMCRCVNKGWHGEVKFLT